MSDENAGAVPDPVEFHEYAHLFPLMTPVELAALTADIKLSGQIHPIISFNGKIIDGRNRFLACRAAGIEPRIEPLAQGLDPLAFVVSTNYARRHLSESQRAMAAARIETHHAVKPETARLMFKVSKSALKQAESVLRNGTRELIDSVSHDRIPVNIAAKLSAMDEDAQLEATTLKPQELRSIVKKQTRILRTVALAKHTRIAAEKAGTKLYPVLYADPAWHFEPWSENGLDRSADNHYATQTTAAIAAMEVPATENAVLFMWCTVPMMPDALHVMKAWNFDYRSQFCWVKNRAGTGYWNRNKHELLLVGVRGSMPAPDPSDRQDSVFTDPVGEHSVKPASARQMIEDAYPNLPKLEMFARQYHDGWDSHGAELPDPTPPDEDQPAHEAFLIEEGAPAE